MPTGSVACHTALHAQLTCPTRETYVGSRKSQGEIHLLGTKNRQIAPFHTLWTQLNDGIDAGLRTRNWTQRCARYPGLDKS